MGGREEAKAVIKLNNYPDLKTAYASHRTPHIGDP